MDDVSMSKYVPVSLQQLHVASCIRPPAFATGEIPRWDRIYYYKMILQMVARRSHAARVILGDLMFVAPQSWPAELQSVTHLHMSEWPSPYEFASYMLAHKIMGKESPHTRAALMWFLVSGGQTDIIEPHDVTIANMREALASFLDRPRHWIWFSGEDYTGVGHDESEQAALEAWMAGVPTRSIRPDVSASALRLSFTFWSDTRFAANACNTYRRRPVRRIICPGMIFPDLASKAEYVYTSDDPIFDRLLEARLRAVEYGMLTSYELGGWKCLP